MTTVTLTSSELRHQKALAILANRGQWSTVTLRDGRTVVGIPSQTKKCLVHLVAADGNQCDCFDARRHVCKHQVAVKLDRIARGAEQPASDTVDGLRQVLEQRLAQQKPVLEMVRHDDGEISWTPRDEQHQLADRYADIFSKFDDETPEQLLGRL